MNEIDKTRLGRLKDTFSRNFRITQMYAEYLERYPEVITKEMIDTLTEDGEITREEALVALLSEIFALDFERAEDRILIRDYLTPSVRLLDTKKYENNPYYKNIKLENINEGDWEIRWEEYPPYRAVISGDMIIGEDFSEVPPLGFFTEPFRFPAVLEGGNEWMTLTPVDLDTCEEAINDAHGKVVTFGLGLGYYAYMASEKPDVESVTVVELSEGVIKLFREHILPQIPNKDKIKIVHADAFEYAEHVMPLEHFDYAFVDTWRDASDGAPMYKKMRALENLSPKTKFSYWIENFLISRLRAEKFVNLVDENEQESYEEFIKKLKKV
ncbi:MAG: hypothetical protein E7676_04975 [Ruminococcaceae bacterium]|nr:hypothetical protein [Oscillospiraceae bacterium]